MRISLSAFGEKKTGYLLCLTCSLRLIGGEVGRYARGSDLSHPGVHVDLTEHNSWMFQVHHVAVSSSNLSGAQVTVGGPVKHDVAGVAPHCGVQVAVDEGGESEPLSFEDCDGVPSCLHLSLIVDTQ